jgi:malonyl-CoA O-methyltransferase
LESISVFDITALKNNFGKAAQHYDRHAHLQRAVREHAIALARNYWPCDTRILDMGAGPGNFAHEASLLKYRWDITSLDLAPGMCRMARSQSARVINADAQALPISSESFDGVFSSLMLQWVHNPQQVFSEMARIMRRGTRGIVSTLVHGTLQELKHAFSGIDDTPHVSDFLQTHDVLAAANTAGLSLELAKQTTHTEYYDDTIALMRSLQAIGATNKETARRKGLMTPKQFTALERAYIKTPQGLPASWQVLYLVLRKD